LEGLEQFFTHMPADSGMAFVVISHQDPNQTSLLPEILQKYTEMPVVQVVEGGVDARQNTVYIKPSDSDLAVLQGTLTLLRPVRSGVNTTIDIFFRHLAEDQDGKAVGIVLSGMGSDGTLGIRALKEHMGIAMAQEPSTAKFGSMPQSAIATGLIDHIAPPEDLPQSLIDYIRTRSLLWQRRTIQTRTPAPENSLAKIFALIRYRTSQDFSGYKRSTVTRRIERRMGLHQLTQMDDYIRYLQENPPEVEILAKEMLIGVTQFFRDPEAWEHLIHALSGGLIQSKPDCSMLRVWIVGCLTGEEAYTMAIVLQECLEVLGKVGEIQFQIFATDVDKEAIDIARMGKYSENIEVDVSPKRLERFFTKENGTYQISLLLREKVIFAPHNVIRDPPFTHLDILSCRNLLIYLSTELQKKLIPLFHYALSPSGILFLGTAESILGHKDLFSTLDSKSKIFQKSDVLTHDGINELPAVFAVPPSAREPGAPQATSKGINDILDFSRAEKEGVELEHQPFNLKHLIDESLDMVAVQADHKGLDLAHTIDYGTPDMIIGDYCRIRQILVNLLTNAVKYTDVGVVSVSVSSKVIEDNKRQILFIVKDTGIGIPQGKMNQLFQPFTQLERTMSRKCEGAGLGLAISKKLAELMGGRIWANSESGKGSTFSFTIPVEVVQGQQLELGETDRGAVFEKTLGQKSLRILVAEDNPSNQRVLVEMLKRLGYRPDVVADGREVIQALERQDYDLVLMDIKMPEMDGITATKVIRRLRPENGPKIVAITAYALEGDREKCLEAGIDDYISKPVQVKELSAILKKYSVLGVAA